ncbi:MAG: hypothetical protein ACR2NH_12845 [Solirubrobacteraceae bacterium]
MSAYATRAALAAYIPGGYGALTNDAADELLAVASRDVDTLLASVAARVAGGLKLDPATLAADQVVALSRATCAQAQYRLAMGAEFFVRDQHSFVSGPDFAMRGELARIGPKVAAELLDNGFKAAVPVAA